MNEVCVKLITRSSELPPMVCNDYFHSTSFFKALENSPGTSPCMATAIDKDGTVVAHMLAIVNTRRMLLPPFLLRWGRVYGEGDYTVSKGREMLFKQMVDAVTSKFRREVCLFAEFSEISRKMFGYRQFKQCGYVPIPWQEIHNSLHSMEPWQRLSHKMQARIAAAESAGVEVQPCRDDSETTAYAALLRRFFRLKSRRYVPHARLFAEMARSGDATHLVTTYRNRIIGGCTLIFSQGNAYMWFMASRRKTYHKFHPAAMTVWGALRYAHENGYAHLHFLDAGLPITHNPYREFILSFGGKPTAKYRWFQVALPWVNRMVGWFYDY